MRLTEVHVTEFKSVYDSTPFKVGDITCLVGKNEAGKTAVLEALYRLKPIVKEEGTFDVTDDYPRRDVVDYREAVKEGKRKEATVIRATFVLDQDDIDTVAEEFGTNALSNEAMLQGQVPSCV